SAPVANQLTYYDFKYRRFLTKDGLALNLFYSHIQTQPGGIYDTYNTRGEGDAGGITLTQPWILTNDLKLSNSVFLTNSNANSIYNTFGYETYNDKITQLGLQTALGFRQGKSWNQAILIFTLGEPWLDAPENPQNPSLPGAQGRSSTTQASFTRTQYFTENFNLVMGLAGQYTRNSLYASQQLIYGNSVYGRAYTSSGIGGDNGYMGRLQANYNLRGVTSKLAGISPYTFYDIGELYDNGNAETASARYSASSAGIGVADVLTKNWRVDTYAAKPLMHNENADVGSSTRYIFSVVGSF
ncbi:MAG: hypothetical protein K5Q00_03670, partial [Gammaproteobacteria bacterium]|nr:hypothetical protein [Gammaproteobacteria bacterium]